MITAEAYARIICAMEKADDYHAAADAELVSMENVFGNTLNTNSNAPLRLEIDSVRNSIDQIRDNPYSTLINAVKKLQQHVIKHYGSVNSFLSDNNITVSPYFASLSSMAGYTIENANIGSSCL